MAVRFMHAAAPNAFFATVILLIFQLTYFQSGLVLKKSFRKGAKSSPHNVPNAYLRAPSQKEELERES